MLPPYGRKYLAERPGAGIWVVTGPDAWQFAEQRTFPVLVLPDDHEASDYEWPSNGQAALIYEGGQPDDLRLNALAAALLRAGAPCVVAIREVSMETDPRVFFYPEVSNVDA